MLSRAPLADNQMARNTLGGMGLGGGAKRQIKFLSGGEKARVALAAFALQPLQVFLADEPSNHLDAATMARISDDRPANSNPLALATRKSRWPSIQQMFHL